MVVVLELNKKNGITVKDNKIWMEKTCFPIKVTLYNKELKDAERIIYIREKKGVHKMMIS